MARVVQPVEFVTSLELEVDSTSNDSDKSFTVDSGYRWQILSVHVSFQSTATVGDRQIGVDIKDGSNVFMSVSAGATQAASLTRSYTFAPGLPLQTSFISNALTVPFPSTTLLLPTWTVQVLDRDAVDSAADDMTVRILVNKSPISDVEFK